MKIDRDGYFYDSKDFIICDMSELVTYLLQLQNYSQDDVTELTEFLTKQPNRPPKFYSKVISVLLDNHTAIDATLQAAVLYINTVELVRHYNHN